MCVLCILLVLPKRGDKSAFVVLVIQPRVCQGAYLIQVYIQL